MGPCIIVSTFYCIYIQQDATLHSLFISGNCSTCFGWYLHPSSGEQRTVSKASGICHTVTATCRYYIWKQLYVFRVVPPPIIRRAKNCIKSIWYLSHRYCYLPLLYLETALHVSGCTSTHHQESKELYLKHLVFVTPLLLPAAIISGNCSTCFGWYLHPSSGEQRTVSKATGICHTVTATCRYSSR
jgi:hypothetical protein